MGAFKNKENGTWYVQFRYKDWTGATKQRFKRGFATKREAQAWEREFLMQQAADLDMQFDTFLEIYERDVKPKLKRNTWKTKEHIIRTKILPYFKELKMSEITLADVIAWQNEIIASETAMGNSPSKSYLKTIHNQLSAIFNHAYRYCNLQVNPARRAGNMGKEETREMLFWTKDEYLKFSEAMMDKEVSFYAFEMLYWTGIRMGELLAITPADFDFDKKTVTINKSYQRLGKLVEKTQAIEDIEAFTKQYDAPLEEIIPEPGTFETVKSYRERKVIPLFKKLIEDICSVKRAYHELMGYAIKINDKYEHAVKTNNALIKRNRELVHENSHLKAKAEAFNYVLKDLGSEKVRGIVERVKERERAFKRNQMSR